MKPFFMEEYLEKLALRIYDDATSLKKQDASDEEIHDYLTYSGLESEEARKVVDSLRFIAPEMNGTGHPGT